MSSTFPLFRLPLVALQIVINNFHLNHLVILSFCSQRAQRILRLLRKKNQKTCIEAKCNSITSVVLKDTFLEDLLPNWSSEVIDRVETSRVNIIEKSQLLEDDRIEFVRVGESVIPLKKTFQKDGEEAILNFYFEERFEGLKVMLNHFTWFFETPIYISCHNSRLHQNQIRVFLDYAVAKQKSIDYCHIHSENTTEEEIRRALDRDSFAVMNGFWFNLDNLLRINCRVCRIWGSKLTSLQMNQYLKRWKQGGYEKTRRISIEMEDINLEVLLAGLNAVNFPQGEKRMYKDENNRTVTIEYGFDIHKNDNTVATIVHHGGNIVSNLFHMIVW
ncbi:hypothetical protein CAEBREN_19518 [Caenorhabditis brenneri]|uniref:Sdz-33 F-box domain-containing protein n=1 Tax=Caenorhabditis brenneri TaxID=135651 RepID=G0MGC0_CAEBE|nr:hypothetical protein CAEBREN_19518 [Caenorhabditis brenneri]